MPPNQPHRIRLRGPWKLTALEQTDAQPVIGRIGQPWDQFLNHYAGPVLYVRHFNQPTGIGPGDRVELAILGCVGTANVSLNRTPLANIAADQTPFRIDISDYLQTGNCLEIKVTPLPSPALPCPAGITDDVQLEIHSV